MDKEEKYDFKQDIELYDKYYKHEQGIFVLSFFSQIYDTKLTDLFRLHNAYFHNSVTVTTPNRNKWSEQKYSHRTIRISVFNMDSLNKMIDNLENRLEMRKKTNSVKVDITLRHLKSVYKVRDFCMAYIESKKEEKGN